MAEHTQEIELAKEKARFEPANDICKSFVEAWQSGSSPSITDYLSRADTPPDREILFRELLRLDLHFRNLQGEKLSLPLLKSQFPGETHSVEQVFAEFTGLAATITQGDGKPNANLGETSALPDSSGSGTLQEQVLIEGFETLNFLGRGGMGVVYKARDMKLNRLVAIKMLLAGSHATGEELHRFKAEAEAIARLKHPNIVQIYHIGEHHGLPYFTMEFCEGGSLNQKLDGTPWNPMKAAQFIEALARGVHAAHEARIIHRDLKPHNILLSKDGTPKVTDFGIAKMMDSGDNRTSTDAFMGTPTYMAPEQAAGKARGVTPATDVYALGAILYQLVTGKTPFQGQNNSEVFQKVIKEEPKRPRLLDRNVPGDLQELIEVCLEKNPSDRYQSALELADQLQNYQLGKPIKKISLPRRLKRLAWHQRYVLGGLALIAILITGLSVRSYYLDPDLPRKLLVAQLKTDQPYQVRQFPGPFRQMLGNKRELLDMGDQTTSIESIGMILWELIDKPPCTAYELSAEVRHESGSNQSEIGFYTHYTQISSPKDLPLGRFLAITFADRGTRVRDNKEDQFLSGLFQIYPIIFEIQPPNNNLWNFTFNFEGATFKADWPKTGPSPWRKLSVHVSPKGVEAHLKSLEGNEVNQTLSSSTQEIERVLKMQQLSPPAYLKTIPVNTDPQSGLGFYVFNGRASFRKIELKALNQ